jgi:hypothetical protein
LGLYDHRAIACRPRKKGWTFLMEAAELRAISDTLIRIVRPEMTPKQLIKAARRVHPRASKKNIVRAAFFLIISHADEDLGKSRKLWWQRR